MTGRKLASVGYGGFEDRGSELPKSENEEAPSEEILSWRTRSINSLESVRSNFRIGFRRLLCVRLDCTVMSNRRMISEVTDSFCQ